MSPVELRKGCVALSNLRVMGHHKVTRVNSYRKSTYLLPLCVVDGEGTHVDMHVDIPQVSCNGRPRRLIQLLQVHAISHKKGEQL